MPHVTVPIAVAGPLVDCVVSVSEPREDALKRAGRPVPAPVKAWGLIDTGASSTCIDQRVAQQLDLQPIGMTLVHTPSTQGQAHQCSIYDAGLLIPTANGTFAIGALPVIEATLSSQGIDLLLGRDVLSRCIMIYDGVNGRVTLAF